MRLDSPTEAVALFTGGRATRRTVLERAAALVAPGGTVHVVRDGARTIPTVALVGMLGFALEVECFEDADFAEAATVLASRACGWSWTDQRLRARSYAVDRAKRMAAPLVLPAGTMGRARREARILLPATL
ncbi:hypothetical protein [Nocardia salmonicida]|uniref:hypothetical protein n=1 Tax=Nocardia salmonicida TaxID=53431 RepID=UPI0037B851C7